ncbi:hypothetical protein [Deinococcus sp. SL84]|uniref:hypothetical protein n=1 Tax=Deinococcus sp. SL84 TaxID=2994663 RepID=UPI002275A66D|nr:hypothetical protein [Deinococcus sp. SL84]MCY1703891.1 hypothetical protein [Deinococcus sp. SL84]
MKVTLSLNSQGKVVADLTLEQLFTEATDRAADSGRAVDLTPGIHLRDIVFWPGPVPQCEEAQAAVVSARSEGI